MNGLFLFVEFFHDNCTQDFSELLQYHGLYPILPESPSACTLGLPHPPLFLCTPTICCRGSPNPLEQTSRVLWGLQRRGGGWFVAQAEVCCVQPHVLGLILALPRVSVVGHITLSAIKHVGKLVWWTASGISLFWIVQEQNWNIDSVSSCLLKKYLGKSLYFKAFYNLLNILKTRVGFVAFGKGKVGKKKT